MDFVFICGMARFTSGETLPHTNSEELVLVWLVIWNNVISHLSHFILGSEFPDAILKHNHVYLIHQVFLCLLTICLLSRLFRLFWATRSFVEFDLAFLMPHLLRWWCHVVPDLWRLTHLDLNLIFLCSGWINLCKSLYFSHALLLLKKSWDNSILSSA